MINYYRQIMLRFHPDLKGDTPFNNMICKLVNKHRDDEYFLKNIYDRLVV